MLLRRRRRVAALVLLLAAAAVALVAAPGASLPVTAAWAAAGQLPGLGQGRVWSVAIDPAQPTAVLAATDRGVYHSADAGQTWQATPLRSTRAWTVAFARSTPHLALAGLDGGGVARSDDGGASWVSVSTGLTSRTVRSIAFSDSLVVAGTGDGVAFSSDGRSWHDGGMRGFDISAVATVRVPQAAPGPRQTVVLAGVDSGPGARGKGFLFANVGPGPAWKALTLPADSAVVNALAVGPPPASTQRSTVLVATNLGVFRSDDPANPGAAWSKVFPAEGAPDQTQTLTTLAFSPLDPNLVYGGDDAGGSSGGLLLRSVNGGQSFDLADTGLPANQHNVAALAVAPVVPPLVLAGVDPSGQGGRVWGETDGSVPPAAPTATPEAASVLPSASALPSFTPPPPAATPAPAPPASRGVLRRAVDWPFPLAVELFVLLGLAYAVARSWQRRVDVEGPP